MGLSSDQDALRQEQSRLQAALAGLQRLRPRTNRQPAGPKVVPKEDGRDNMSVAVSLGSGVVPFVPQLSFADVDWDSADEPPKTVQQVVERAEEFASQFEWHDPIAAADAPASDDQVKPSDEQLPTAGPTAQQDNSDDVFARFSWE